MHAQVYNHIVKEDEEKRDFLFSFAGELHPHTHWL
jgi:hypothetical protein